MVEIKGRKNFLCPYEDCERGFSQKAHLKRHISAVHKKLKPFLCPYKDCKRMFSRKPNLRGHISAVHKKLKPFPCPYEDCGMMFSLKGNLERHISAVHKGEMPFVCPYEDCGKRFSQKITRNRHEKSHNGVPQPIWNKQSHRWEEIFKEVWEILKPGTERAWKPHLTVIYKGKEFKIIPEERHLNGGYVIWDAKRWKGSIKEKDIILYPLASSYMEFFVLFGPDREGTTPDGTSYSIVSVDTLIKRLYEMETPENAQRIRDIYDRICNCREGFFDFELESLQNPLFGV